MSFSKSTALIVSVALTLLCTGCNPGFQEEDIKTLKQTIKTEFEKQPGFSVTEVTLLKETPRKLTGFVKLNHNLLGSLTKSCSATMGEDGKNYIWRCE